MNASIPPIAKTLINLDLVKSEDLTTITQEETNTREILREIIGKGLISSAEMSKALANQFGIPLFDLDALSDDAIPQDQIEMKLVEKHSVLPLYHHGKHLYVGVLDPTNKSALDEIKFYSGLRTIPLQIELGALENKIAYLEESNNESLEDFLGDDDIELALDEDDDGLENNDTDFGHDDAPIVKYVNKLLVDAINQGASDIHIEPFEKELRVRFRVDGILHKAASQPVQLAPRIAARIKILSKLDIAERRAPQDARAKLKICKNKAFDFLVNTLPTVYGEKVVMRILDSSAANLDLTTLGFTETQLEAYEDVIKRPYGMVLITGPTGSGKTVTLYSALNKLNDPSKNISTVEDPVEIQLSGITQVNINEKANLHFADALRAFLRQDPDIIMLGEIRDLETAEIAIKASQTGHMVLSTLHTNDAPSTLTRLLNMGIPAFNVASAVNLIVAQRLCRKLCTLCKEPANYPDKVLLEAGFNKAELKKLSIFQANTEGCTNCTEGYKGRSGVFQVMPISETIKTLIMEGCTEQDIERTAKTEGILDLRDSGLHKIREGITSLEEIERVTNV